MLTTSSFQFRLNLSVISESYFLCSFRNGLFCYTLYRARCTLSLDNFGQIFSGSVWTWPFLSWLCALSYKGRVYCGRISYFIAVIFPHKYNDSGKSSPSALRSLPTQGWWPQFGNWHSLVTVNVLTLNAKYCNKQTSKKSPIKLFMFPKQKVVIFISFVTKHRIKAGSRKMHQR